MATYFIFDAPYHSRAYGGFCRFSIRRDFTFCAYLGKLAGECVQCIEAHFHPWRYVASVVVPFFIDEVVSDACAGINDEDRVRWLHGVRCYYSCQSVHSQGLWRVIQVPDGDWRLVCEFHDREGEALDCGGRFVT